jgi:hypothetical protein
MTRLPKGTPPKPDEFRARVRDVFGFLGEMGFREEPVPSRKNPVAVWFTSDLARVVVEGVNWGLNTRVALGRAGDPAAFENYDLGDLLAVRGAANPAALHAGDQAAQMPRLAAALQEHGADVLAGDFNVFLALRARVDERIARFRAQQQAP